MTAQPPAERPRCIACAALINPNRYPFFGDVSAAFAHHVAACHGSKRSEAYRFVAVGQITRRLAAVST